MPFVWVGNIMTPVVGGEDFQQSFHIFLVATFLERVDVISHIIYIYIYIKFEITQKASSVLLSLDLHFKTNTL